MFNTVDRFIISVLAPMVQADMALSDTQMGLLLGPSFSVVHFLAVIPAAWLADRYARRTIVAVGLFLWSGMTALGAFAPSFLDALPDAHGRRGGRGGRLAAERRSAQRYRSARVAHPSALSSLTVGALVGLAVGMIVGGAVGQQYGWRDRVCSRWVVPGIGIAFLVRFTLREPPRTGGPGATPIEAARHLFGIPSFRWALAGVCVANIAIAGRALWEPSFLSRAYGLSGRSARS